jgi:esterase/lipase
MQHRWMIQILLILIILTGILLTIYIAGPKVDYYKLNPNINWSKGKIALNELDSAVKANQPKNVKPGNEAEIIWADSVGKKTKYAMVYLHGFSASKGEGEPIHRMFAKKYGINTYLARLQAHGLETDTALKDFRPIPYLQSAKDAIKVAATLGDSVIVMGTSTGGTLALYLAASNPDIHSLFLFAPNISLYDPAAPLLDEPWGYQIARMVMGGEYRVIEESDPKVLQYWYNRYHIRSLTFLQSLLDKTMTHDTFSHVEQPVYCGYYYKNDEAQDKTVSVEAILSMQEQLATPPGQKRFVAFENGTEHVIVSQYTNPNWKDVFKSICEYTEEVLGIVPVGGDESI